MSSAKMMFARYGRGKTSIEEIVRMARVAKGTIYNYLGSKDKAQKGVL
jgi:AcrR family transcriptional regulator